jgi:hypothetical protein
MTIPALLLLFPSTICHSNCEGEGEVNDRLTYSKMRVKVIMFDQYAYDVMMLLGNSITGGH